MTTSEKIVGRSVDDILEACAGGLEHNAVLLAELASAAYACREEWGCYDTSPGAELARMCEEIEKYVNDLSLAPDGQLTLNRECRRCSGKGSTLPLARAGHLVRQGEDPCIECGGSGYVHASEADG